MSLPNIFKTDLVAVYGVDMTGQTVIAGKSSSSNGTLSMVLVLGSISQLLENNTFKVML